MDLKRAIIYGFLSWLFICIISSILAPFLDIDSLPYINLSIPITIIVVTGFFGILYIREFNEHEIREGFKAGIVFFIMDIICDLSFFVLPRNPNAIVEPYSIHLVSMFVLMILITTFIGYLAQMTISLR